MARGGIDGVDSRLYDVERGDGRIAVSWVQPVLPADTLGPVVFAGDRERAVTLWERLLDMICACVSPRLGLDGQLSNWSFTDDGAISYLDISTPLMRDDNGRETLDADLFLSSLPWGLRPVVKRLMLKGILATYYDQRRVIIDFLGNLCKGRLDELVPTFVERANRRLERPIAIGEIERYYRSDARTWALLQRLRRMDRGWQRHVRRRPYPFLLPGTIER